MSPKKVMLPPLPCQGRPCSNPNHRIKVPVVAPVSPE